MTLFETIGRVVVSAILGAGWMGFGYSALAQFRKDFAAGHEWAAYLCTVALGLAGILAAALLWTIWSRK